MKIGRDLRRLTFFTLLSLSCMIVGRVILYCDLITCAVIDSRVESCEGCCFSITLLPPPLFPAMNTVEQLQGLRRNELQSICKTYELRANGKKEVLIELIIEHERSYASSSSLTSIASSRHALQREGTLRRVDSIIHCQEINNNKEIESGRNAQSASDSQCRRGR